MSKLFFQYLFAVALLCSCNSKDKTQIITGFVDSSNNSVKDSVRNDTAFKIFEGLYIYNLSENTFMDCKNPDSAYWVIDESKKLSEMYKKTFVNPNVYGSVVAKVKGKLALTTLETRKEKYPITLIVKDVVSTEKKNFRNTCVQYDYWALGNEPNWSLQISEKENLIEFNLPADKKVYYFFYEEPKEENGIIFYKSHNEIQRYAIDVSVKKEKCSDTMSDKVYEYSVEVEISGGKKYRGCGIKGSK